MWFRFTLVYSLSIARHPGAGMTLRNIPANHARTPSDSWQEGWMFISVWVIEEKSARRKTGWKRLSFHGVLWLSPCFLHQQRPYSSMCRVLETSFCSRRQAALLPAVHAASPSMGWGAINAASELQLAAYLLCSAGRDHHSSSQGCSRSSFEKQKFCKWNI